MQTCRMLRKRTRMGSKKEEALDLLKEMRGFVGVHLEQVPDVMYRLYNMVDDLKDIVISIDECHCSVE